MYLYCPHGVIHECNLLTLRPKTKKKKRKTTLELCTPFFQIFFFLVMILLNTISYFLYHINWVLNNHPPFNFPSLNKPLKGWWGTSIWTWLKKITTKYFLFKTSQWTYSLTQKQKKGKKREKRRRGAMMLLPPPPLWSFSFLFVVVVGFCLLMQITFDQKKI